MAQQFEYDMKLKQAELENAKSKEKQIEDRKDERTRIQATQQSKMISQRQNDSLPTDFESNQFGGIFKTTDGGQSWSRQDSANYNTSSSFANVVYFWDENVGLSQGDPINGEFELYVTSDGGNNWNQVPGSAIPNPLGGEYGYTRQIEVVGDNVWFTTNRGRVFVSADKGNNWDVYETPLSDFGGAEENGNLSFSDSQNGIIIDNNANVYRSYNGGFTWEQISTDGLVYTSGLCFIEGTNIVFSTGGGSSFSPDGGFTWGPIDTTTHLYVDFFSPEMGWSGGWTQVEGPNSIGGVWKWEDYSLGFDEPENDFDFDYYPNPYRTNNGLQEKK